MRRTNLPLLSLALPLFGLFFAAPALVRAPQGTAARPVARKAPAATDSFKTEVMPLVAKYCAGCHGAQNPTGGVSLVGVRDTASFLKSRDLWQRVAHNVRASVMPPAGLPQPTRAERDRMVAWIEGTISRAECNIQDPGRVTMRRLNRVEYNNTIRDLFGIDLQPANSFPSDDVGYGFDNIGDVLSISPLLMEKYLSAAEKVVRAAIVTPESSSPTTYYQGDKLANAGGAERGGGRILASVGEVVIEHEFPKPGEYLLRVRAYGEQAGSEPVRMAIRLDGKNLRTVSVRAAEESPEGFQEPVKVAAGKRRFAAAFLNDYYKPDAPDPGQRDRNLIVEALEIQGPMGLHGKLPPSHKRIFIAQPTPATRDETARKILGTFARRAYRRPVTAAELDRLVRIVRLAAKEGESFERGIQVAVQAALVSPHFLFRVETDPKPNDRNAKRRLNDFELASRLSYFLWSSMPDEALFDLAARKMLQDPKTLVAQVQRMLRDPKAKALSEVFGGQWLTLRRLSEVAPDPKLFPQFNDALRQAMRTETELFFREIVREDRSVLDFLDGRFTYVNEPLAKLYGLPGVKGDAFRRVSLAGTPRAGVMTQASILTVTSNPTRTSLVKRGKWVLEQLMGTPPPPPPPDAGELKEDAKEKLTGTVRQRLEQHRKNPICASCHTRMDPIGFGLENFDAIGRWRTREGEHPVDSSGVLPGGQRFQGPTQLISLLKAKQQEQFVRNLCQQMMTYALGRGLESYDRCNLDAIAKRVAAKSYRFSAIVTEVVQSDPFRMRRGDGGHS
jgi:mono/diheme cytochrome c family protein